MEGPTQDRPDLAPQVSAPYDQSHFGKFKEHVNVEERRAARPGLRIDWPRYQNLTYEDFRRLAADPSLSDAERIGAPDALRAGMEPQILSSIIRTLELDRQRLTVLDIGCGCGRLANETISHCLQHNHELVLTDSAEVLTVLPEASPVRKVPGRFPASLPDLEQYVGRCDAIIVYSVLHYVFAEASVFDFVDACLTLLAPEGTLMLGDLPNISKRKRFLSSNRGRAFHRSYMNTCTDPEVTFNKVERHSMDDAVILALATRARLAGFDAYVQPQPDNLPYANRREDIVVRRP